MLGFLKVGFSFRVHSVKELIDFMGKGGGSSVYVADVIHCEETWTRVDWTHWCGIVFTTIICFDLTVSADLSTSQLSIFS